MTTEKLRLEVERLWIRHIKLCQDHFLYFVQEVWPDFICRKEKDRSKWGHHQIIAHEFTNIAADKKGRLIINMPPRHTKSEFASVYFPAWIIGKYPKMKIMQVSHNTELAVRFGSKVRNIIDSPEYKQIFGNVKLREDSKAKGRWETNHGGEYYAAGVGASITGRGADLLIIDDPHSEQDALNMASYDRVYEWYTSGPRQRLQPGGRIIVVMTRWSVADLTGKLMKAQKEPKSDQWEVIEFPAILPSGKPVWPGYWKLEELEAVKASVAITKWNAQYQQNPTAEEGSIIKSEWWNVWEKDVLPALFRPSEDDGPRLILLDLVKDRYEFPELRRIAKEQYDYWKPETVIVEAKASGLPLTYEMRKLGIPVINFTPSKGNDKHTRVNAVAPLFEAGMVWYPDRKFAEEVIEECAAFPLGEHDDLVDSMTQAVMRFRQGGFVEHPEDYADEPLPQQQRTYY